VLTAAAVSQLLCAIAADGHAAPASPVAVRSVQEEERAFQPFAGFDEREIFVAYEIGHGAGDGKEECIGRTPSSALLPFEPGGHLLGVAAITNHDLTELLVARQDMIDGSQLLQCARSKRLTQVAMDKLAKPFAQRARLARDRVQLAGNGIRSQVGPDRIGDKFRLSQPVQKFDTTAEPLHGNINGGGSGVEEVEA